MRIRVKDIPASGRELHFELDVDSLNARIAAAEQGGSAHDAAPCVFFAPVKTELRLELEGSTVVVEGAVRGHYATTCARCAEDTQQEVQTRVHIVLQPLTEGADRADEEDVSFGRYEDGEIECSGFVEEFLILALPYSVICSANCKGLCSQCGQNLNLAQCECSGIGAVDLRFAALADLKLKH